MPAPVFIGDEATAAGYRLAGVRVIVPEPGGELAAWQGVGEAELVLMTAAVAQRLPPRVLEAAQAGLAPLFLEVPALIPGPELPDLARQVRARLGLEVGS